MVIETTPHISRADAPVSPADGSQGKRRTRRRCCAGPERPAYAAVFWDGAEDLPALTVLAEQLGPRLLLPECWQRDLPQCGVLISLVALRRHSHAAVFRGGGGCPPGGAGCCWSG